MAYTFDISDNRRIVEALKVGDEETFKEVYTAFCAPLRNYAATILQNEQAAYEVVQDVFTAVWLNRKRLDAAKPLRNYLLRAVHNNSLRLLKYDEARRRREISAAAELHGGWEQEKEVPPPELGPAISRLPEQSRKVLMMSYWENKKNAAIATELSISVRTVETILYKVVKKLRGEIKKK